MQANIIRKENGIPLAERVSGIMHREWRCVFDPVLLEGMLYEGMLGQARARLLSIGECRARAGELGLPSPCEIAEAAREAIGSWERS